MADPVDEPTLDSEMSTWQSAYSDVPGTSQCHASSSETSAETSAEDCCPLIASTDWTKLPDIATTVIASFLLPWERALMALTCSHWHHAIFECPSLWRAREFRIHGNWRDNYHLSYVKSVGRYLKSLHCTFGFRSQRHPRRLQKLLTAILAELFRRGPVQLKELSIADLQFQRNFQSPYSIRAREGILRSMKRFLRKQVMLEKLDFSNAIFKPEDGSSILSAVTERSSASLHTLYIDEMFKQGSEVHSEVCFANAMGRFTMLVSLTLNYSCVSGELLVNLAANNGSTLELLHIITHRLDNHEHAIVRYAWVEFTEAASRCCVKVSLSGITQMDAVYRILNPGMPLRCLRIYGHNDGGFHPDRALRHLARHFNNAVERVVIDMGPVYHSYTRGILAVVQQCKKLQHLQVHGRITWTVLRDVFDFIDEEYIKKNIRPTLSYLRVVITTIGYGQEEALVMEEFRPSFIDNNLNYDLVFDPMYPMPLVQQALRAGPQDEDLLEVD